MSKMGIAVGLGAAALVAASASGVTITNNAVVDRPTLTSGFSELNLSSYATSNGFLAALSGANLNTMEVNFAAGNNSFSGTLRAEVYGNQGNTGTGLTDIIIIYTMTANGFQAPSSNFTTIDAFTLGVNTGTEIDFGYLVGATHGRIDSESAGGQADPLVDVFDNAGANDTFRFDYNLGGGGDGLGAFDGTESYTWYVQGDASTAINVVDVTVTDGSALTTQTLSLVSNPGQPDLDVPAPGALALAGLGFGALGVRRRRA